MRHHIEYDVSIVSRGYEILLARYGIVWRRRMVVEGNAIVYSPGKRPVQYPCSLVAIEDALPLYWVGGFSCFGGC